MWRKLGCKHPNLSHIPPISVAVSSRADLWPLRLLLPFFVWYPCSVWDVSMLEPLIFLKYVPSAPCINSSATYLAPIPKQHHGWGVPPKLACSRQQMNVNERLRNEMNAQGSAVFHGVENCGELWSCYRETTHYVREILFFSRVFCVGETRQDTHPHSWHERALLKKLKRWGVMSMLRAHNCCWINPSQTFFFRTTRAVL